MISLAGINHLDQILKIEQSCFKRPWSQFHFKNDIFAKNSKNWVYLIDNMVVDYLFGWCVLDEYHINNLAISKSYRNNKLATELLIEMKLYLKKIKVKSVFLEVSSSNLSAIKLYEKNNFIANGKRKDYYTKGDDAILYTLEF